MSDLKSDYSPADQASRYPLLFLILSGLGWLVLAGILGILASVQRYTPAFLDACPILTIGRTFALAETAFVYGWLANAGLALVLWVLVRLAGEPLRAQNWAFVGTLFWNLGVTVALVGVATGDRTGFPLLELPAYVQPILLFSYGAIAIPGILAWGGRLRRVSFASHWYAAAALFGFPWILGIAHVTLFSAPVHGVVQPVVAAWYAQSAWSVWLAPLALAVAYYLVPKLSGKVIPSYEFASLGFWILVVVGGLTAGRQLVGGPVPAWIPALATVSCAIVLFQVVVVFLNLRRALTGPGVALKYVAFGLVAYVVAGVAETLTSFHAVALHTQFTYVDSALHALSLYGAVSVILLGGVAYAVPRITGKGWLSGGLIKANLVLTVIGVVLWIGALAAAGFTQSGLLLSPQAAFADIAHATHAALSVATAGQALVLLGNILLLADFVATLVSLLSLGRAPETLASAPAGAHAP